MKSKEEARSGMRVRVAYTPDSYIGRLGKQGPEFVLDDGGWQDFERMGLGWKATDGRHCLWAKAVDQGRVTIIAQEAAS